MSSFTWPFDLPYAISYWLSFGSKRLSACIFEIFRYKHIDVIDHVTILSKITDFINATIQSPNWYLSTLGWMWTANITTMSCCLSRCFQQSNVSQVCQHDSALAQCTCNTIQLLQQETPLTVKQLRSDCGLMGMKFSGSIHVESVWKLLNFRHFPLTEVGVVEGQKFCIMNKPTWWSCWSRTAKLSQLTVSLENGCMWFPIQTPNICYWLQSPYLN